MKHVTVLKDEAIHYLNIKKNGIYVDATLGGAGHSLAILEKLKDGFLYAFDQDLFAIEKAKERLSGFTNFLIIDQNFANIKHALARHGVTKVDGILMDLGMSSFQIDDATRGFSYMNNHDLDMRMDNREGLTAQHILNTYSLEKLTEILEVYGEEKNAYKIARKIIAERPLLEARSLVKICDQINYKEKGHSAKKVFQALRIEVNQELTVLKTLLEDGFELLNEEGTMVCLTFHSLEDRIVKHFFKHLTTVSLPKNLPIKEIETPAVLLTKKPIYPSLEEMNENSRSKSAKLRAIKKNKA